MPTSATGKPAAGLRLRAVTLIELLVVIVLIGVTAGLIVPRMGRSMDRRIVEEAAGRFAHTARTVAALAVSRQETCAIEIDLDAGRYVVLIASNSEDGSGWRELDASWIKRERWPDLVKVASFRVPGRMEAMQGKQRLMFFPDGTSSGASIELECAEDARKVVVLPHNGAVVCGEGEMLDVPTPYDLGD